MKKRKGTSKLSELTESNVVYYATNVNTCVCCGAIIPEGTMICIMCEKELSVPRCMICNKPLTNEDSVCPGCKDILLNLKEKE